MSSVSFQPFAVDASPLTGQTIGELVVTVPESADLSFQNMVGSYLTSPSAHRRTPQTAETTGAKEAKMQTLSVTPQPPEQAKEQASEGMRLYMRYLGMNKRVVFNGNTFSDLVECVKDAWHLSVNPVLSIREKGSDVPHLLGSTADLYNECTVDVLTYSPERSNVEQKSMRRHYCGFAGAQERNLFLITARDRELGERIMDKVNYYMKWNQVQSASFSATGAKPDQVTTGVQQALIWLEDHPESVAFLLVDCVEEILQAVPTGISVAVLRVSLDGKEKADEIGDVPKVDFVVNGSKITVNSTNTENATHLIGKVAYFLSHLHLTPRPIYLVRHGQSEYNLEERIGGDCDLTDRGRLFAVKLGEWAKSLSFENPLVVWTSTLLRAKESIAQIDGSIPKRFLHSLDEINAGVMDGMTYGEIESAYPEEAAARKRDKFVYRYPRGESYEDLTQRLEPVILEMERRQGPLILLAHQAVLRCIFAYLNRLPLEKIPHVIFPSNTVLHFEGQFPDGYESHPLL